MLEAHEHPAGSGPCLLLVDDEPNMLNALRRLFRREPYQLLMAASGAEGLELLDRHEIGVIISDYRMPEMTGVEFLRLVKDRYPDSQRIVLSGFTDLQSVTSAINEGAVYKFLTKPWDDGELREITREAFRVYGLQHDNRLLTEQLREANTELERLNQDLERRVEEKTRHLKIHAASLRVSQELLEHLPFPVLGVGDDSVIAYGNRRATERFQDRLGPLIGQPLAKLSAQLADALVESAKGSLRLGVSLDGDESINVNARRMGANSSSRGWVITFLDDS